MNTEICIKFLYIVIVV